MTEPSTACLSLVAEFEGCKLEAYQDQRGIWTIGYGKTEGVTPGMCCSQAQAEQWLLEDLKTHAHQIRMLCSGVELSQSEFDALVSLCYNIGAGNFAKSTLLVNLKAGNKNSAAEQFLVWNKTNGQVNPGLARRRQAERALFVGEA